MKESQRKPPFVICHEGEKRPIGNDWGNHSIDAPALEKRLKNNPRLNVGILLGQATGFVDVECDGESATAHYAELFGHTRTPSWSSKRGCHYLYRYDDRLADIPSAVVKLPSGLEFRIGNEKQIQSIIPPSVVDGVPREWVVTMADCELALLPEPVVQLLLSLPQEVQGEARETSRLSASPKLIERATQYAAKLPGVKQGERDKTAFANAGHIFSFVDEATNARLDEQQVLNLIRVWNSKNDPPLSDAELQKCVGSAMKSKSPRVDKVVETDVDLDELLSCIPASESSPDTSSPVALQEHNPVTAYLPFPSCVFPSPINKYIDAAAKALDCDPSFIGVPMLSCLARAVGNRSVIELKPGHIEQAIVWTCTIGESGVAKTPAIHKATCFIEAIEDDMLDKQKDLIEQHKESQLRHTAAIKKWQKDVADNPKLPMPTEPEPIELQRLCIKDCTLEAMALILSRQKDGLIVMPDELDAWMKAMNQYRTGKGSDLPIWLSIFSGNSIKVDRVKNDGHPLMVKRPCVSVTGSIQPSTLKESMTEQHLASGFTARFLLLIHPTGPHDGTSAKSTRK
jgi:hypothetical protein